MGGKSNCGVLSYSMVDAKYADHVVVVTDCLVEYPNLPASISQVDVDYVVEVEAIGNPDKIVRLSQKLLFSKMDFPSRRGAAVQLSL